MNYPYSIVNANMIKHKESKHRLNASNVSYVKENIAHWANSVGITSTDEGVLNLASVEIGVNLYLYVSNEGYIDYAKVRATIEAINTERTLLTPSATAYLIQDVYLGSKN